MSSKDTLKLMKDKEVEYVDLRFTDPRGKLQHLTMDASIVDEDMLENGVFFDGSSIAGWKAINESDMILKPDLSRLIIDPFNSHPTLNIFCDILDAVKKDPYERDPRGTAKKAEAFLKKSGIGDKAYFGPEPEFFVFDDVLDLPEHQNLFNYLKTLRWTSEWSSSTHTGGLHREDPIWHWNYSFFQVRGGMPAITPEEYQKLSVDHPAVIALWEKVSEIIKQHLGKFNILRLYSNCNPYGNSGYPHIDDGDYTMVYYPCVKWDSTWEGGTCFYEGTQDKENEYDAIRYVSQLHR